MSSAHFAGSELDIVGTKSNIAGCYRDLGRYADALALRRKVLPDLARLLGNASEVTINAANSLAVSLSDFGHYNEIKPLVRKYITISRRSLGEDHIHTLRARAHLADALMDDHNFQETVAIYEDVCRRSLRVLGESHPDSRIFLSKLLQARAKLAARAT